ncbi:MAG: TrmH family RNA methyltransferase [Chloroflexota bacterium]
MKPQTIPIHVENNDFQYLEVLRRNRVKRQRERVFFVEGVMAINRAIEYGWQVSAFAYTREKRLSDWAETVLLQSQAECHFELSTPLMTKLSEKDEISELIAVVEMPVDSLDRIPLSETALIIILDRPMSPGNLGSIIRSADAFSVDGLIITGHAVDLFDPKTIRASRGSIFALPTIRVATNQALYDWLQQAQHDWPDTQIIGTSAKADESLTTLDFNQPTILMMGNETTGLRKGFQDHCNNLVKIPIGGSATSLNLAAATSIFLYEAYRQRGFN